jgi:hypothetical protein
MVLRGMPTSAGVLLLCILAPVLAGKVSSITLLPFLHASPEKAQSVQTAETLFADRYGGAPVHVQKGSGYFTVARVGKRWTLVTPDGNAFWMRGVQHTSESFLEPGVLQQKYGTVNGWAMQRNRRLLSWGFNTLGEYHEGRGLPVGVYGSPAGNPAKMPFIVFPNILLQALNSPGRFGLQDPLKNIVAGTSPKYYSGWRGRVVDVYDPHLSEAYRAAVVLQDKVYTGGFEGQSWVLGITPDDADVLFLLKGGPNGKVNKYAHPVFLIAITKFSYTAEEDPQKRDYKDHKLYSKYAWAEFLKKKYGSIETLNSAWGSNYSSFDDDGGYGDGRGLLDEDGRHSSWIGTDSFGLTDTKPAVRSDMDAFLYEFSRHYAETAVKAIRESDHHHLIFAPNSLNSWGARARDQVLRGLADGGFDAFFLSYDAAHPDLTGDNETYDITGKPAMIWYGVTSNRDSAMHTVQPIYAAPDFPTQQERGAAYSRQVSDFYNARGKNGDNYIMGIDFWELYDNRSEKTNWGLVSRKDNAYDGKEAVRAAGKDPWGYPTGGEEQDYGDFLSGVRSTNFGIQEQLTHDLASLAQKSEKSGRQ